MQLESLSTELQELGGGNARVAKYNVCVLVGPRPTRESCSGSNIRQNGASVVIRDPRAPADTPSGQCERSFQLPDLFDLHDGAGKKGLSAHVSEVCATPKNKKIR